MGGARYILVIVDDYTRYGYCYLMKNKSEVFNHFRNWLAYVEKHFDKQVAQIQTDRGSEFMSERFQNWLRNTGIFHRKTSPYSAFENGLQNIGMGSYRQ